jgi:hypothetical protein
MAFDRGQMHSAMRSSLHMRPVPPCSVRPASRLRSCSPAPRSRGAGGPARMLPRPAALRVTPQPASAGRRAARPLRGGRGAAPSRVRLGRWRGLRALRAAHAADRRSGARELACPQHQQRQQHDDDARQGCFDARQGCSDALQGRAGPGDSLAQKDRCAPDPVPTKDPRRRRAARWARRRGGGGLKRASERLRRCDAPNALPARPRPVTAWRPVMAPALLCYTEPSGALRVHSAAVSPASPPNLKCKVAHRPPV